MSEPARRHGLVRRQRPIHQFLTGATSGDAITNHALILRRWLREAGHPSEIFAQHIHESAESDVQPISAYRRTRRESHAIYHHSIGSDVPAFLQEHAPRLILVYHNVTPAHFFTHADPAWAERARQGLGQLETMRDHVDLALAVSHYNEQDLYEAGYANTGVLPIALDPAQYDLPDNPALASQLDSVKGPRLLFVGRLAPNKRQEDLVKLLYCYRRIRPAARLILVGDRWDMGYDRWVERLAADLELDDALMLTGKVNQQDMVTYYRHADLYVSMSEHEGFGQPLVESMLFDLPVLAYASSGIPHTLGKTGVMFHEKDFERLAELVDILVEDKPLRARLIVAQRQRVQQFLEPEVRRQFFSLLERISS